MFSSSVMALSRPVDILHNSIASSFIVIIFGSRVLRCLDLCRVSNLLSELTLELNSYSWVARDELLLSKSIFWASRSTIVVYMSCGCRRVCCKSGARVLSEKVLEVSLFCLKTTKVTWVLLFKAGSFQSCKQRSGLSTIYCSLYQRLYLNDKHSLNSYI